MSIKIAAFKQVLKIVEKSAKAKKDKDRVFDYSNWFSDVTGEHGTFGDAAEHPCGTSGCIGGWACILSVAKKTPKRKLPSDLWPDQDQMEGVANQFLGTTQAEGSHLFYGGWHQQGYNAPTRSVIAKLKNIIKTGKVINPEFDARYQL